MGDNRIIDDLINVGISASYPSPENLNKFFETIRKLGASQGQLAQAYRKALASQGSGRLAPQSIRETLVELGDTESVQLFLERVSKFSEQESAQAARDLGASNEEVFKAFTKALHGERPDKAVEALLALGDRDTILPIIRRAITTRNSRSIAPALARLGEFEDRRSLVANPDYAEEIARIIVAMDTPGNIRLALNDIHLAISDEENWLSIIPKQIEGIVGDQWWSDRDHVHTNYYPGLVDNPDYGKAENDAMTFRMAKKTLEDRLVALGANAPPNPAAMGAKKEGSSAEGEKSHSQASNPSARGDKASTAEEIQKLREEKVDLLRELEKMPAFITDEERVRRIENGDTRLEDLWDQEISIRERILEIDDLLAKLEVPDATALGRAKGEKMHPGGGSPAARRNQEATAVGGINLNPAMLDLQIKRDGNGVPLPLPMQPIGDMKIEGFFPVIINVTPINLPLLMGFNTKDTETPANKLGSDTEKNKFYREKSKEAEELTARSTL